MRSETAHFINNARSMLERGRLMLGVPLYEDAGRAAYLACFHVAQALIFESEQRVLKTHHGVQSEFHRLTKNDSTIDGELRGFLSQAYRLKTIADYDLSTYAHPSEDDARAAIETATRFVDAFARIIGDLANRRSPDEPVP